LLLLSGNLLTVKHPTRVSSHDTLLSLSIFSMATVDPPKKEAFHSTLPLFLSDAVSESIKVTPVAHDLMIAE
jgi:hypothetical protein